MFEEIFLASSRIAAYRKAVGDESIKEIKKIAKPLRGLRVVHVNSTAKAGGGGVAEILRSLLPLMRDVGLNAKWTIITPPKEFFGVTQKIHDSLQGSHSGLSDDDKKLYIETGKKIAESFKKEKADVWIFHDPQPLAIPFFADRLKSAISRIHIDLSSPNKDTWNFLLPFFEPYKKIIFSMDEFVNPKIPREKVKIFAPAIDPLISKNKALPRSVAKRVIASHNIHPDKPLIAQISRFDRWKDPIGVIKAFYIAKNEIPDLQLVLLGLMLASDNPRSATVLKRVQRYVRGDPANIHLLYDPEEIKTENETLVNAFQAGSDVVIQKSIKEGFGLTVTEAMWKGKPVIGGRAGGIKLQIKDGRNGFLVSSPEECGQRIVELIKNPALSRRMGRRARESVKKKFLIPRLLRDYLNLFKEVLE